MRRLRGIELNPVPFIVLAVVAVGAVAYFAWLKPRAQAARIQREWATPEAAAQRGPGRQFGSAYESKLQELLQKEGRQGTTAHRRRHE